MQRPTVAPATGGLGTSPEWTYNFNGTPYLYGDHTTLGARQRQIVTFVGASYVYKFM